MTVFVEYATTRAALEAAGLGHLAWEGVEPTLAATLPTGAALLATPSVDPGQGVSLLVQAMVPLGAGTVEALRAFAAAVLAAIEPTAQAQPGSTP